MKEWKRTAFAMLILISVSFAAFSDDSGGSSDGGGNAIQINESIYSFDLFENGVQDTPYFGVTPINQDIKTKIASRLPPNEYPVELIAKKISEIAEFNFTFALALVGTVKLYSWHFVEGQLAPVSDQQDTVIDLPETGSLLQAAVRDSQQRITISKSIWKKMNDVNRAALILHELIYALTPPMKDLSKQKDGAQVFQQDSRIVRRIVGFIFSTELRDKGWKWLMNTEQFTATFFPYLFASPFMFSLSDDQAYQEGAGGTLLAIGIGNVPAKNDISANPLFLNFLSGELGLQNVQERCAEITPASGKKVWTVVLEPMFLNNVYWYNHTEVNVPFRPGWVAIANPFGWDAENLVTNPAECQNFLSRFVLAPRPFHDIP